VTLASGIDGDDEALPIGADARVLGATLTAGETAEYRLGENRQAYLVVARGTVEVNGMRLFERDGAAIEREHALRVVAVNDAEMLLVDAR
jgi:quercetin 2,3-dioxygenase